MPSDRSPRRPRASRTSENDRDSRRSGSSWRTNLASRESVWWRRTRWKSVSASILGEATGPLSSAQRDDRLIEDVLGVISSTRHGITLATTVRPTVRSGIVWP